MQLKSMNKKEAIFNTRGLILRWLGITATENHYQDLTPMAGTKPRGSDVVEGKGRGVRCC